MATTPMDTGSSKRAFWLPDMLHAKIRDYVSRHRNAPENMTINSFVREALEDKISRDVAAEKGNKKRGGA